MAVTVSLVQRSSSACVWKECLSWDDLCRHAATQTARDSNPSCSGLPLSATVYRILQRAQDGGKRCQRFYNSARGETRRWTHVLFSGIWVSVSDLASSRTLAAAGPAECGGLSGPPQEHFARSPVSGLIICTRHFAFLDIKAAHGPVSSC